MNELHPHWQSTDGEVVPVRARTQQTQDVPPVKEVVTVSRKPAAIVGMVAVLVTGAFAFKAVDFEVVGQASNQKTVNVRITDSGFMPKNVEVEHGETITWTNETDVQHAVQSALLCSNTGFCLQTAALGKNAKGSFTITPDIPAGSYAYASAKDTKLTGTIEIVTTAAQNFENLPPPANENTPKIPVNPNAGSTPIPTANSPATTLNPLDGGSVPVNPYTIDSARSHPFDDKGDPKNIASVTGLPKQNPNAIQQNKKPLRQPTTGAGEWIVISLSAIVLWFSAGRALRTFSVIRA
ncbi:hypothetical protein FJZ28_03565 [Candidatus Peregrinibacteria bacterium]|nr:hypothetical protein [Candidatus Peregrinibacteria bacterium]